MRRPHARLGVWVGLLPLLALAEVPPPPEGGQSAGAAQTEADSRRQGVQPLATAPPSALVEPPTKTLSALGVLLTQEPPTETAPTPASEQARTQGLGAALTSAEDPPEAQAPEVEKTAPPLASSEPLYRATVTATGPREETASTDEITARELRAVPVRTAEDALRLVPGLTLVQHGSEGKGQQFFLRGFDAEHGSGLELTLEGIPLNEWSNVHALGYLDLGLIIPEAISAVEVQKGPFSLDQGAFGLAGSATYRLGLSESMRGLRAGLTLGTTGRVRGTLSYTPRGGEGRDFLVLEGLRDAGFGMRRGIGRGAFTGQVRLHDSARFGTLTLLGAGNLADFELPGTLRLEDVREGRIGFYDAYDPNGRGRASRGLLALRQAWQGRETHVASQIWLSLRELSLRENYTGYLLDPVHGDARVQAQEGLAGGAGLSVEHALFPSLSLDGGLSLRAERLNQGQRRVGSDGAELLLERAVDADQLLAGGRVGVRWRPVSALQVAAGARLDLAHVGVRDHTEDGAVGKGTLLAVSPRLTARWRLRPGLRVFLAYGRGFRPPEARAFTAFTPDRTGWSEDLDEGGTPRMTQADAAELGVRWTPHRWLGLRAAAFATFVARESIFDHVSGLNLEVNATRRLGAELQLTSRPLEWLTLEGDLTAVDGRFVVSGNAIPHAPTLVAGLLATATHTSGWRGGLRLTALGPRPLPHGARGGALVQLDATGGYDFGALDVGLALENLLFSRLREGEYHYASDWRLREAPSALPVTHFVAGPPFNVRLTVTAGF